MAASLTSEELTLVREVWETGCSTAENLTATGVELFIQLFTEAPHLQAEFRFAKNKTLDQLKTNPRMAIHSSNFINVIRQAVENAEDMSCMQEYLEELGGKHSRFGAKSEHFGVIRDILMGIFRKKFDEGTWKNEHEQAWVKFYDEIFKVDMVKGLEDAQARKAAK